MKRRRFLATAATLGALPTVWHGVIRPRDTVEIRYWVSPGAREYGVQDRIGAYVEAALDPVFDPEISFGGVAPVGDEHGYRVTRNGEWPRLLYFDRNHGADLTPAADVNLLVTDGPLHPAPTGMATGRIASIGGARHLADLRDRDEVDDVVPFSRPSFVMHLILHEVGHVLGLAHEHGDIQAEADRTVVTPMVSAYAWTDSRNRFADDYCACGTPYPTRRGGSRHLSLSYSDCARDELASGGGFIL